MKAEFKPPVTRNILRCPACVQMLTDDLTDRLRCVGCGAVYRPTSSGALDMRLREEKAVTLRAKVGRPVDTTGVNFSPLPSAGSAAGTWHISPALMQAISSRPRVPGEAMLDLGCGKGMHRELAQSLGYEWVGMDYYEPDAPMLADAHALPFMDGCFGFVLSLAVLEHLRNPLVAMSEVYRVMKPGGMFIGTVAFLEPFHGDSYYHHTHLGTLQSLQSAGFRVTNVAPQPEWSVLDAQAEMSLFPRMPAAARRAAVAPLKALHRLWWAAGERAGRVADPSLRLRQTAGSFAFIAHKD